METTTSLVRYDHKKLDKPVPSKQTLQRQARLGVVVRYFGLTLLMFYIIWALVAIAAALYVLLARIPVTELPLPMPPVWMLFVSSAVMFIGLGIESSSEERTKKYHEDVHQGEIVMSEFVQKKDEPFRRRFTVRGYTLANELAFQTRTEKVSPETTVDDRKVGDTYDVRDQTLRAASLEA